VRLIQKLEEPGSLEAHIKAVAFIREMCGTELDNRVEPDGVTGRVADRAAGVQDHLAKMVGMIYCPISSQSMDCRG
jgi:hypothetical protein